MLDTMTTPGTPAMNREELREFAQCQVAEIERYRWFLGVQLGRDPLLDRSYNDIACEWIHRFSADFRKKWVDR